MTRARIKVHGDKELIEKIRKVGTQLEKAMRKATLEGGEVAAVEARRRAPGPYIETEIVSERPGRVDLEIGPDAEHWYYQFFETGASSHEIDGNVKQALAFIQGAEEIVVKRVRHPGIAAEPFMRPALEENQTAVKDAMINVFNIELDKIIRGG